MSMISPLAYIHSNARIGNDVTIDPFAVIHEEVTIGDGSHIMSNAVIMNGSIIGKMVMVFPGAVIGAIPQDLKFIGEKTIAQVGDNTTVRECVTINRGTVEKYKTVVGSNCLLMAYSHIAHDCILGNNVILGNCVQLAGHVLVDDYAIISGMSGAQQFAHIGAHAYIAGHTVVRKDVPPFIKAAREPLSYMGVNLVGLQRRGFSKEAITAISNIYHTLFVEKHTTSAAIELIEATFTPSAEKDEIIHFVKSSQSGIIRRPSKQNDEDNFF